MTLLEAVGNVCIQSGYEKKYWIAYSGGLDSHVLLSLCHSLRQSLPINLHAIHINHGLSPHAADWSLHCAKVCAEYGIDYIEKKIEIDLSNGDSLEEIARNKRYAIFAEFLEAGDILLTAHHQDDQAETLLMQLFRGAGPKGLAAMPEVKPFSAGWHCRPLLPFSRAELLSYAKENQLRWIEDESNANRQLTRNFIRHDVMPLLKQRWPTIARTISRSAGYCAEAQALLEEFALGSCKLIAGSDPDTLSVAKLLQLEAAQQKLLLRSWIQQRGHPIPDAKKLAAIQTDVLTAAWDATPCVLWQETELRRYRDDLYLMQRLTTHDVTQTYAWNLLEPLILPNIGTLAVDHVMGSGLSTDVDAVTVGFRQGGEMVEIHGYGRRTLKNLFQEWNIPPWQRERIPLIFAGDKLIAVVGYFLDEMVKVKAGEQGRILRFDIA